MSATTNTYNLLGTNYPRTEGRTHLFVKLTSICILGALLLPFPIIISKDVCNALPKFVSAWRVLICQMRFRVAAVGLILVLPLVVLVRSLVRVIIMN